MKNKQRQTTSEDFGKPYWECKQQIVNFHLTHGNFSQFVLLLQKTLTNHDSLIVNTNSPDIGNWSMARLWRQWMDNTSRHMAASGCRMPLVITSNGENYGTRLFDRNDAHELFTATHLGVDAHGMRLSWAKQPHDDMRPADQGERIHAMQKHEEWASQRGIVLITPRDSEYMRLKQQQDQ